MNNDTPPATPGLLRTLGPITGIAITVGTVIGSGVFKKPQIVAASVPEFGMAALVWVLGGLLAMLGALALAEVAVLYPKAGGNYVFLREGYGRCAGFLWGWVEFWMIRAASLAALATIFTESLHDVLRNQAFQQTTGWQLGSDPLGYWSQRWLTVAVIMVLAMVNMRGVRWGGGLQLFITLVKVGSLLGIAALPFVAASLFPNIPDQPAPRVENLQPFLPSSFGAIDWSKFGAALVGVLWAYHGWMNIAPVAEEVRNPNRNIPISLLGGVAIIIFLYLSANLAYYLIIPRPEMAEMRTTTVATEFSLRLLGPIGAAAASAAVMCSVFGALNGNLLVGPRLLYAMGEDGLAPRALSQVHARYHTPVLAILVMAVWASLLVLGAALLSKTKLPTLDLGSFTLDLNLPEKKALFDVMTDFAIFGAVIFETAAVATIFVFRWKRPDAERPYRCWGYPFVPTLYVIILAMVAVNMFREQRTEALIGLGFMFVGLIVYFIVDRRPAAGQVVA